MFVKKGIVLPLGAANQWDDSHVLTAAPIIVNDKIYLYYTGYNGTKYRIGLAISEDGMNFVKKGVIIPLGNVNDWDDDLHAYNTILRFNDKLYMYYIGGDGSGACRVGLAISEDGFNFVKKGVVIDIGGDSNSNTACHAVILNDKIYLYYTTYVGAYRIALAISEDGVNFVKKGIVIPHGNVGQWDDVATIFPSPVVVNDKVYLYYSGSDNTQYRGGLAISEDGFSFVKKGVVIPLGAANQIDDGHIFSAAALKVNNKIYLYYGAHNGACHYIALAISEDGF